MPRFYPLTFIPVLKSYIWGGRGLADKLGRSLPPGIIAESWDISGHPNGITAVANGPRSGLPLTTLQEMWGLDLVGRRAAWAHERGKFPLLIKLLDAATPLSVQVHPTDAYALTHEGNELGKTEMWVVLRADADAGIILGVSAGTTREQFRQALAAGQLEPHLHRLPVRAGDVVCVPAGTLHAILGGVIIAEIQQNSDTTYRVFDWNRLGADGQPRPLHVDKALEVIDFRRIEPGLAQPCPAWQTDGARAMTLCQNPYFITERVEMDPGARYEGAANGETLEIWGCIGGAAALTGGGVRVPLPAVQFVLLPAAMGPFVVEADGNAGTILLRTYLPAPEPMS
ncbi:MAG: class I mannose-6-phosphate isomerase [Ardenticatenales bacterium]|nr:class I mannose-6-phosphate isomerase [Ardenticatenales bacterium]